MILPSRFGGRSRSWTRRAQPIGQPPVTGDDAPTVCQPPVVRFYSAEVPAKWNSQRASWRPGLPFPAWDAQALRPIDQRHQVHGDVADCDPCRGGGVSFGERTILGVQLAVVAVLLEFGGKFGGGEESVHPILINRHIRLKPRAPFAIAGESCPHVGIDSATC